MKKLTIITIALAAILMVLVGVLVVLEVRNNNQQPDNTEYTSSTYTNPANSTASTDITGTGAMPRPWEQTGAKKPEEYTWEEFLDLDPELQIAFQNAFGSADAFEEWMNRVMPTEPEQAAYPWDQPGAKQPKDYTWEEFLALSPELQIIFQNSFGSVDALEEWLDREMPQP